MTISKEELSVSAEKNEDLIRDLKQIRSECNDLRKSMEEKEKNLSLLKQSVADYEVL